MQVGDVYAGRYRVDRKLGQGGMGVVYAATNLALGRPVALKVLLPDSGVRDGALRRFLREARASAAIRHPNVIEVLDVVQDEQGVPAIVMELLEGAPFSESLHGRPMPLRDVADVLVPVCSGVGTAHARGIVHRDLKPENVFMAREPGGAIVPKVLDFGIAKLLDPLGLGDGEAGTRTGAVLGTPHYMAPEQAFGERTVDHRADVWSIGVILYEALAGVRPFDGENAGQILRQLANPSPVPLKQHRPDLPSDVLELVRGAMQPNPHQRVADLVDVVAVLARHARVRALDFPRPTSAVRTGEHGAISDGSAAVVIRPSDQNVDAATKTEHLSTDPTLSAPASSSREAASTSPMSRPPPITEAAVSTDAAPTRARRTRAPIVAGLAAVVLVGAFFATVKLREEKKEANHAAPIEAPSPIASSHAIAPPSSSDPIAAPSSAHVATTSTAPASATNDLPPSTPPSSSAPKSGKPKPAVSVKVSTQPLEPAPTPSTAPKQGGLIETVPF